MNNQEQDLLIYFRCPEMDLRDVAIVSQGVHRAFNEAFAQGLELHHVYGRQQFFLKSDDPQLLSLEITDLSHGSLSARTRAKLRRGARDLAVGAAGSLIASAIISIGAAGQTHGNVDVTYPQDPIQTQPTDVRPHIRDMAKKLDAGGKPWELTLEHPASGTKIIIRSGYR